MFEQRKTGYWLARFRKWNKGIHDRHEERKKHYFALSILSFALFSFTVWVLDALGVHMTIASSLKQRIGCYSARTKPEVRPRRTPVLSVRPPG